jgi:hypothetical protein
MDCYNLESIEGEIKIDDEVLLLQKAEVRENATTELDTYEFLIEAIGSDCNQILKFRFYASVSNSEILEGEFTLIESIVYTANHITSFTYTIETIQPSNFEIEYAVNGEGSIINYSNNEHSIDINAELSDNKEVKLYLRYQF